LRRLIGEVSFMMTLKGNLRLLLVLTTMALFLLASCSSLPLIGKKKKEGDKDIPAGKTITIEGMEQVKGVNPPKTETPPPSKKPSTPPPAARKEPPGRVASVPTRPFSSPILPLFQMGFKKKVVVLDFENKTTYQEEKIGETAAKRLVDKLEATQRVVTIDQAVLSEMLKKEGFAFENLSEASAMKRAYQSFGIQAFFSGIVTDMSILSSKASEASEEEVSFATSKLEIRLIDASTGNLLKTFVGRSPIFGTKEAGEYSRSKAVLRAIDFSLEENLESLLRQLDYLDWTTSIAKIEGENIYLNAGKLSGLRIGDTLEIYEPGKEIIHPVTQMSLGWTTGQLKGVVKVTELFGVDAAIAKAVQGSGFDLKDVVKSTIR